MENSFWNNIQVSERYFRSTISMAIILALIHTMIAPPLVFAVSILICLYLLLTSLIAWDPLYAIFYEIDRHINSIRRQQTMEKKTIQNNFQLST